jgi:tetraacyldisaccharide 4'-kinase
VPVVSIGNLTMGGTGKTPSVLRIAELLQSSGHRPGILTRGYGRGSPEKELVLAPGAKMSAAHSGDEPQIFLRSGLAPVGIGADRFSAGRLLLQEFPVDVLLLDDGFQHVKLARDLDLVLIDGLNPFGGGQLFPLGRLREPLAGLARADAIIVTRSGFSDLAAPIESAVRRWNPRAPVFRACLAARAWVENRTGTEYPAGALPLGRAAAFCGLGNPLSFWRTLENLGIEPVDRVEFGDHHRYRPYELRRLAAQFAVAGAAAVVTTQKDAVNLCESCDELLEPLPLFWLKVTMGIENESALLDWIEQRLRNEAR